MGLMRDEVLEISRLIIKEGKSRILLMGVQNLLVPLDVIIRDFDTFNIPYSHSALEEIKGNSIVNAIDLFKILQCVDIVDALDCSDYEGANIICDLNDIRSANDRIYDLIIDGGTLEHIFNVANALNNMNSFVKCGGHIYHLLPCAGWVDHGFYSFSPTFFIDAYNKESGFELLDCRLLFKQPKGQKDRLLFSQDCRLLTTQAINQLINDVSTSGGVMLKCLAEKKFSVDSYVPMQSLYNNLLWVTNTDEKKIIQNIAEQVGSYSSGVFLFGAGFWFNKVFDELSKNGLSEIIEGVFDSDVSKSGKKIRGKMIYYPTKESISQARAIIISTLNYEEEVYMILRDNKCKAKIISPSGK